MADLLQPTLGMTLPRPLVRRIITDGRQRITSSNPILCNRSPVGERHRSQPPRVRYAVNVVQKPPGERQRPSRPAQAAHPPPTQSPIMHTVPRRSDRGLNVAV